ncbi:MAG: DUF2232 domain-containing protein [Desulfobulbaceae bacterium]|uniref:DUF2232 domain-containing protein n=1 Tax=Candidatus Desulfobia pelagia TaxID=2841692 RepID=A0A8J6NCA3_9BACT|nr:DUF2232 domain-containing protein [Candidatus Desulfobia pelagia]
MTGRKAVGNYSGTDLFRISIISAVFILPVLFGQLGWFRILIPLPVFYFLLTTDWQKGNTYIITGVLSAGAISLLSGRMPDFLLSCTLLPVGYVLAKASRERLSVNHAGLNASVVLAVTWISSVVLIGIFSQTNPYSETLSVIDEVIASSTKIYQQSAEISDETAYQLQQAIEQIRQIIPAIFPALLLITVAITVWLNIIAGLWLLKRQGYQELCPWSAYGQWQLPEQLVWIVIASGVSLMLPVQLLSRIGLNVLLVSGTLYFFQGIAVLAFLLGKWSVPRPFRIFIYVMVCVQAYGMLFLAIIGLLDVWINFRKKHQETT